ncbi:PEGA domain-containing protein [Candidatus Dojkabacteria bacterium]|nr:PEGA domain-containing protein [Candidatus Dojkabacteria bacterium]
MIVILYSKGYRFVNNTIIQTGSITIKSNVRGAELLLNGKSLGTSSSKILTGLEVGDYTIEVKKENYHSYSFPVRVKEGLSYSVYSKLFRTKSYIESETLLSRSTRHYFSDEEKNTVLAYTEFADHFTIQRCNISFVFWSTTSCNEVFNSKEVSLTNGDYAVDLENLKLIPAPDLSKVLLQFDIKSALTKDTKNLESTVTIDSKTIVAFTTNTLNSYIEVTNIPTGANISDWAANSEYLILTRNDEIISHDFAKSVNLIILSGDEIETIPHTFVNGSIVFVNKDGIVSKALSGNNTETIVPINTKFMYQPLPAEQEKDNGSFILNPDEVTEIHADLTGTMFVIKVDSTYWFLDTSKLTAHEIVNCYESNCKFVSISPDSSKAIINISNVYFVFWLVVDEWDYLTTYNGYEIADCTETSCNFVWGDDSGVVFFWKNGTISYSDLWGINKNELLENIESKFTVLNDSGSLVVGKINETTNELKLVEVTVR